MQHALHTRWKPLTAVFVTPDFFFPKNEVMLEKTKQTPKQSVTLSY